MKVNNDREMKPSVGKQIPQWQGWYAATEQGHESSWGRRSWTMDEGTQTSMHTDGVQIHVDVPFGPSPPFPLGGSSIECLLPPSTDGCQRLPPSHARPSESSQACPCRQRPG